jgi:enoyl-CoA hydratase/carnithine racemase/3-hydroxyacyl-CoA dehydrogenase
MGTKGRTRRHAMSGDTGANAMRQPTLVTLGGGGVLDIFRRGRLPFEAADLTDQVFGTGAERGSMIISGAGGTVGAGKTMQLGARLVDHDVRMVALDFPNAPDGIGRQYPALVQAFGVEGAQRIMANVVRLSYDGKHLPAELSRMRPKFLLEAIPEILDVKRAHYAIFREQFPGIEIRSVTSGFPASELGVGIAHPAFPHQINKIWEIVEPEPSAITQLLWALGLIPVPVSDHWSFVLDVLFCGLANAALRYHHFRNVPYWKADKLTRKLIGPNPLRAHDAIGAAGANFLTWSCLHHLSGRYGELFTPTPELVERKDSGQDWYPPNHFRPLVNWTLSEAEESEFATWILGPLFQMTALMLHEGRAHLSHLNAIGELCAQFRRGIVAVLREHGTDGAVRMVERYHALHPEAKTSAWHPRALEAMDAPEWQQLYVNAEHDGTVGVITISRESYNGDVDAELNRAIDWLKAAGVERVILSGDFHLSTQMVGADTAEFYPAVERKEEGERIAGTWSRTARRLHEEFAVSVGVVAGKRALGGMLELLVHCHVLVAVDSASLGFPEVTLPVVPGMEGCHWTFRKAKPKDRAKLVQLLLTGRPVRAQEAVGWLVDYAGPLEDVLATAWGTATGGARGVSVRTLETGAFEVTVDVAGLPWVTAPGQRAGREAIADCIRRSCGVPLAKALDLQAKLTAAFMVSPACRGGVVGTDYAKTMLV